MKKLLSQRTSQEYAFMINRAFFCDQRFITAQSLKREERTLVFENLHFFFCTYTDLKMNKPLCLQWYGAKKKKEGIYLGLVCTHLKAYEKKAKKDSIYLCMADQNMILSIFPLALLNKQDV